MRTLAQSFVDGPRRTFPLRPADHRSPEEYAYASRAQEWATKTVYRHLRVPTYANLNVSEMGSIAERFAFNEDPTETVAELVKARQVEYKTVMETMRLPAKVTWVEWAYRTELGHPGRMGFLMMEMAGQDNPEMRTVIIPVQELEGYAGALGILSAPVLPALTKLTSSGMPGHPVQVHWWLASATTGNPDADVADVIRQYARDAMDSLFLLSVPRVCEVREPTKHSPKVQKARVDRGKHPLLEVRQVLVRVGKGNPRYTRGDYSRDSTGEGHRRLHRVIGHFRTYTKGRELPRVSFVEEHWRGDAELGVLLHEREVEK